MFCAFWFNECSGDSFNLRQHKEFPGSNSIRKNLRFLISFALTTSIYRNSNNNFSAPFFSPIFVENEVNV